jgi:hypothetical protein
MLPLGSGAGPLEPDERGGTVALRDHPVWHLHPNVQARQITDRGGQRFRDLMLDTTTRPGDHQRRFLT